MAERQRDTPDAMLHFMRLIAEEQANIQQSLSKIAEYSHALGRVSEVAERKFDERRLLTKE